MIIKINPLSTTTLLGTSYTTNKIITDEDYKTATYASLTTTIASSDPNPNLDIQMSESYLDSLTDSQIIQMEQLLTEKEDMLRKIEKIQAKVPIMNQESLKEKRTDKDESKIFEKTKRL